MILVQEQTNRLMDCKDSSENDCVYKGTTNKWEKDRLFSKS